MASNYKDFKKGYETVMIPVQPQPDICYYEGKKISQGTRIAIIFD